MLRYTAQDADLKQSHPQGCKHFGLKLAERTRRVARKFEIEPPLTPVRLKARYKALVKLHHPDAHGGDKAAEEKLKIINQAYATLKASYFA